MMDGIVMCAHTSHPGDYWTSIHRPIVAFDRVLGDGISSIGSDHEQGGRLIAQMLIRNGAKHVVMIGGPRDQFFDLAARGEVEEGPFDLGKTTFPTVRYYLTLEQELTSAGVKYEYVEAGEVMDFAGYHRAVSNALDKVATDGVDAVVSSDIGASFCVREALSRGISIPNELQIVAYDGTYLTDLAGMKLPRSRRISRRSHSRQPTILCRRLPMRKWPQLTLHARIFPSRSSRTCLFP